MKQILARHCPQCKQYAEVAAHPGNFSCPHCAHSWGKIENMAKIFEFCPVCQCRQFYLSKDFNQFLGCMIMVVGIALVPFTYGISLPVFALVDWLLHKRVATVIGCYKCGCEFRGFTPPSRLKPFIHQIGLKYDKYR